MKRYTLVSIFFLICLFLIPKNIDSKMVMSDIENTNHYELIFDDEILNFRNIKLKLGVFTSYDYNITKIYLKNNKNLKEYFSFDSSNFNRGIEKLKYEYNLLLKENNLYDELDKDIDETIIERVEIYANEDALTKFEGKYPGVIIKKLR